MSRGAILAWLTVLATAMTLLVLSLTHGRWPEAVGTGLGTAAVLALLSGVDRDLP